MLTLAITVEQPKRVILRLRVAEFEKYAYSELFNAIKAYLTFAGYSLDKSDEDRYYPHIELPFPAPELRRKGFHMILDMEKDMIESPDLSKLSHEIYHVLPRNEQDEL